jgi:hypothetical protein
MTSPARPCADGASATIPERSDQQEHRGAKGARGPRPPGFDKDARSLRAASADQIDFTR